MLCRRKIEKIYNKLVRDEIPKIIENDGDVPITKILSDDEYGVELYKKLKEECNEVLEAKTQKERIEELADVLEIIRSISELNGAGLESVIETADQKRLKKGGFERKIFLEKTISKK